MRSLKRIAALVLCLMMLVTAFPVGAIAAEGNDGVSVVDASATGNYKPFYFQMDFEDAAADSKVKDYASSKLKDTGITYVGSDTIAIKTENGNSFSSNEGANTGLGFYAPELFSGQILEIKFDTRLSYNAGSGADALFFPLVRTCPTSHTSNSTANLLVLKTPAEANREGGKLMGQLRYTTGTGTAGESKIGSGYNLYADTWYTFRVVYDASTTLGYVYMTEEGGREQYLGPIDCFAMNTIDRILFGRGYGSTFVNMDIDNFSMTSLPEIPVDIINTSTDFEKLAGDTSKFVNSNGSLVDASTEGAVNPITDATFNATSGLSLEVVGNNMGVNTFPYYVGKEANGNTYLAKRATAASFNLYDAKDAMKNGKFEISFDLLTGDTLANGGILSLKDGSGTTGGNTGESRILSIQTISDVKYLVFGKDTAHPILALSPNQWVRISITVDPAAQNYEIWVDGKLVLYTRTDLGQTTAEKTVHKVWRAGAWASSKISSTSTSYPFDKDLATQVKYLYFFHAYSPAAGIDNLRVRTLENVKSSVAKTEGTLYDLTFGSTVNAEYLTGSSPVGLKAVSVSPVPSVSGGALVNDKAGSSRLEMALSTDSYTYLEGGVLCVEGKIKPSDFAGNTGKFVFAALNRYTSASIAASANLVTIDASGKVSVGNKTNVATLSATKTHTLKVYVDTETMLVTLFVDGVRKALNVDVNPQLRLAPIVDTRDVLVPAIGADGFPIADVGNSSAAVADYVRYDFGTTEAVLDTLVLFDSTVVTDTWGFTADNVTVSYEKSVAESDIDFDFDTDILDANFTATNATVSGGALTVAEGGSLIWNDANLDMVDWLSDRGFAVELKLRADADGETKPLVQMVKDGSTYKDLLAIDGEGKILAGGEEGKYPLADADSDKYTAVQLVFVAGTSVIGIYADGKILGAVDYGLSYMGLNSCGLRFLGEASIDELKIHRTLTRDYATESGNIFDWDMNYYTPNSYTCSSPGAVSGKSPTDGFLVIGTLSTMVTPTEENGENRAFLRRTGTGSGQSEVFATGHLHDTVTVLEATLRNTVPAAGTVDVFRIRKGTYVDNGTIYLLQMNAENGYFYFKSNGLTYYLCDEDGNEFTANSDTEWTTVAAVYDAVAATVRYTVNGQLAYAKRSGGSVLGFADGYAVNELDWNSLKAEETRVRLYIGSGVGTFDLADYRAYEIDPTATAEIVGAQVSAKKDAIRVIAGLDMLHYGSIGFKVEYFDKNGRQVGDAQIVDDYNVFYTVNGGGETYSAEDFGYRYLTLVSIEGIESTEGYYRVTPFTTLGGVKDENAVYYYGTPYTILMDNTQQTGIRYLEKTTDIADAIYDTSEVVQFRGDGLSFNGIDAVFTFSANCAGEVSLNLVTARQVASVNSSTFELWIDGVKQDDVILPIGHHTLTLARGLEAGEHTFKLVKKTGGDYAHIYDITLNGTFTNTATAGRKNGVMLEVSAPAAGMEYGNFYVYTQTSDPSGKYYIKYNFIYEKDDTYLYALEARKGNTGYNRKNYRIREAFLMEYDETAGTFTKIWQVLHQGEISVAIKESGSADFIGGYHGDEKLELVSLFADGAEIDLTKKAALTSYSKINFNQTTVLCTSDKPLDNVLRHIQNYVIDSSGIRNHQQLEILSDNFKPLSNTQVYMQMFTFYRTNTIGGETVLLHDRVNLLDTTGNLVTLTSEEKSAGKLNTFKASDYYTAGKDNSVKGSVNTRYMEYIGANNNGLYGKVGFNITSHSVKVSSISGNIRQYNDVKWYPSIIGRVTTPAKGELWELDLYYTIDYVKPNETNPPETPDEPDTPDVPEIPDEPDTPVVPDLPTTYTVYKFEDYENAPEKFGKYAYPFNNYDALTATDKHYTTGGQFSGISTVGALEGVAYSGKKALNISPFAPYSNGSFSARIKFSQLFPDDIKNYLGCSFRISAYVRMDGMSAGEGTTISAAFGAMGDKETKLLTYSTFDFKEGEWTYVEHEFTVTEALLAGLTVLDQDASGNDRYYPLRVFLNLGGISNYPSAVYIDDMKIEYKAPSAQ